ncbi:hypothetical protein C8J56DRAFT_931787 [Mycena floridula]|nr:hypothetical protein C8J56DRAFT_931787 [Mycena floridula]
MSLQQILDLDSRAHDLLFSCLSKKDLITISKLNSVGLSMIKGYQKRAYQVNKILSRYFSSAGWVDRFRWLQARTGLIISGSTALQFFDRTVYEDSDMDLYVHESSSREVSHFLIEAGYTFVPRASQVNKTVDQVIDGDRRASDDFLRTAELVGDDYDEDHTHGIAHIFDFHKGQRKIQLITAVKTPFDVIFRYHSTAVLNFITHKTAYSLYPYATFVKRRSVRLIDTRSAEAAIRKYERRGWIATNHPLPVWDEDEYEGSDPQARWIGDSACWTIALPDLEPETITAPPIAGEPAGLLPDTLRLNSWTLGRGEYYCPTVAYGILEDKNLRLCYTVLEDSYEDLRKCENALSLYKRAHRMDKAFIDEALLAVIEEEFRLRNGSGTGSSDEAEGDESESSTSDEMEPSSRDETDSSSA